jgi:hypothetical protein
VKFEQTFGLPAILGTEAAAAKHHHHWILLLQLGELAMLSGVVAKLIVGKGSALDHVGSHLIFSRSLQTYTLRSQINHDVT